METCLSLRLSLGHHTSPRDLRQWKPDCAGVPSCGAFRVQVCLCWRKVACWWRRIQSNAGVRRRNSRRYICSVDLY